MVVKILPILLLIYTTGLSPLPYPFFDSFSFLSFPELLFENLISLYCVSVPAVFLKHFGTSTI